MDTMPEGQGLIMSTNFEPERKMKTTDFQRHRGNEVAYLAVRNIIS
jgi:hypothetical protein